MSQPVATDAVLAAWGVSKRYRLWKTPAARLYAPASLAWGRLVGREPEPGRYYRDFQALAPLDLEIRPGECLGIIGKNGSGKSTLLQILAGTLQPTNGEVVRRGQIAALLELGTGFNPEFTGRENVFLYAAINGLSREQTDAIFDSVVEFSGLADFIDQPLRTYSSGMKVRLAFSVLTHLKPDILIIDEALAVGDAAFVQKCMRWLRGFIEEHTVLFVSHSMSAITDLCSRAVWLRDGQIAYQGHPKRTTELYLESIYEDQGKLSDEQTSRKTETADADPAGHKDVRSEVLQAEPQRNELAFTAFDPGAQAFGQRQASIAHVEMQDELGNPIHLTAGGEVVRLLVFVKAETDIVSPIVGFGVKDRMGRELFHDNTFITSHRTDAAPLTVPAGRKFVATFVFRMPYFPHGQYFVFAAVATGVHDDHVQQHWVHEALRFSANPNRICLGLLGLPMMDVRLDKIED